MKGLIFGLAAVAAAASAGAAYAHHSNAMYDRNKEVVLNGTVKEFQWSNPHSFIQVLVPGEGGAAPTEWSIETASPNGLSRSGWTRNTLKPGDQVAFTANPLRSGEHAALFVSGKRPNGEILKREQGQ